MKSQVKYEEIVGGSSLYAIYDFVNSTYGTLAFYTYRTLGKKIGWNQNPPAEIIEETIDMHISGTKQGLLSISKWSVLFWDWSRKGPVFFRKGLEPVFFFVRSFFEPGLFVRSFWDRSWSFSVLWSLCVFFRFDFKVCLFFGFYFEFFR